MSWVLFANARIWAVYQGISCGGFFAAILYTLRCCFDCVRLPDLYWFCLTANKHHRIIWAGSVPCLQCVALWLRSDFLLRPFLIIVGLSLLTDVKISLKDILIQCSPTPKYCPSPTNAGEFRHEYTSKARPCRPSLSSHHSTLSIPHFAHNWSRLLGVRRWCWRRLGWSTGTYSSLLISILFWWHLNGRHQH